MTARKVPADDMANAVKPRRPGRPRGGAINVQQREHLLDRPQRVADHPVQPAQLLQRPGQADDDRAVRGVPAFLNGSGGNSRIMVCGLGSGRIIVLRCSDQPQVHVAERASVQA